MTGGLCHDGECMMMTRRTASQKKAGNQYAEPLARLSGFIKPFIILNIHPHREQQRLKTDGEKENKSQHRCS